MKTEIALNLQVSGAFLLFVGCSVDTETSLIMTCTLNVSGSLSMLLVSEATVGEAAVEVVVVVVGIDTVF